jgi:hypothetical protein
MVKRGDESPSWLGDAREVDRDVLEGMDREGRNLLTQHSGDGLSLRKKQKAGAEYLATLVGHPKFRERFLEWAMENPGDAYKIASSERPKEIHVEEDIRQMVVLVPASTTESEWQKLIINEGEK